MDATRLKRIRWRCRRGMLENDIILSRFLDACADTLTEEDIANLDALLHMPDSDLWDLLAGRTSAEDPALRAFVARVCAA
jgi:antitoxin CptB